MWERYHTAVDGLDPTVDHVAIIVDDLGAAVEAWSQVLGVRPSAQLITLPYADSRTEYRGNPTCARLGMAFFDVGDRRLELGEPVEVDEASVWADQLIARGGGLHHLGFRVSNMDRAIACLAGRGMPVVQRAEFEGGRYAYIGSEDQAGAMIELLEFD